MARTKQTARKSSGGSAPRQQLSLSSKSRVSSSLRNYLVSGQQLGRLNPSDERSKKGKASFLNSDSILGSFSFSSPPVEDPSVLFTPNLQACKSKDPLNGAVENYVSMTFSSACDGGFPEAFPRPFLDVVISLDISGSMGSRFGNDVSSRSGEDNSKLGQAKRCLFSIFQALEAQDRISIVLFNHNQDVWLEPTLKGNLDPEEFKQALAEIRPTGGTHLADGFEAGLNLFEQYPLLAKDKDGDLEVTLPEQGYYLHRILFMTDMQSGVEDENAVLTLAEEWADRQATSFLTRIGEGDAKDEEDEESKRKRPRRSSRLSSSSSSSPKPSQQTISCSVFTTVIGIGVDLSVGSVERISATRGGKYISVASSEEFERSVASEFLFDMIPCVFNLQAKLMSKQGYCIDTIYGSSELNSVASGSKTFTISSEFPNPTPGTMNAILVLKLKLDASERRNKMLKKPKTPKKKRTSRDSSSDAEAEEQELIDALDNEDVAVKLSYISLYGEHRSVTKIVALPAILPEAMHIEEEEEEEEKAAPRWKEGEVCYEREGSWTGSSIRKSVALSRFCILQSHFATEDVPEDSEDASIRLKFHQEKVLNYKLFKKHLLSEMAACSETSLSEGGSNENLLTTLNQMIDGEEKEVSFIFDEVTKKKLTLSSIASAASSGVSKLFSIKEEDETEDKEAEEPTNSYLVCPITLEKMQDPVIAADGHSYERRAIEAWFASGKTTSPNTGLPLPHTHLVSNIALKNLVESS